MPIQRALPASGGTAIQMTPSGFHAKPVKRFARNHSVKIQAAANRRTNGNLSPRPYRHASPAAIAGKMARYRESRTTAPSPNQYGMASGKVKPWANQLSTAVQETRPHNQP